MQHICPPNHSANLKTEFLITYYTFISPQKLLSYEIGIFSPLDIKAGFPTEILYIPPTGTLSQTTHLAPRIHCLKEIPVCQQDFNGCVKSLIKLG